MDVDTDQALRRELVKRWRAALPAAAEIHDARRRLHLRSVARSVASSCGTVSGRAGWPVGFVLAVTFPLAHCVEGMAFEEESGPHRGKDFVPHGLRTTSDVASPVPVIGHPFRWVVGGLDHQIEHHLAPRLPHTAYRTVARRFREACEDLGVAYHRHSGIVAAVRSHARWLKQVGQPTSSGLVTG